MFLDVEGAVSASATQLVLRGEANGSSTVWDLLWRLPKADVPFVMVDGARWIGDGCAAVVVRSYGWCGDEKVTDHERG
jgi:hypothetical protein